MIVSKRSDALLHAGEIVVEPLTALGAEIERAMSFIARNDLHALEQSVRNQENLCAHLRCLLESMVSGTDASSLHRVQLAAAPVRDIGRSYLLLLEHAGTNARQLHRLCRSYAV